MRGDDNQQEGMFSYVSPEQRVPADHPLRPVRKMVDETVEESKQYLSKLGVRVDEIRTAPLSSINVGGTPTMMLVNDRGIVKNVWVGKLPEEQQTQVLSAIASSGGTRQGGL